MAGTRLQDDLLHEFREQKRMIQSQIDEFEPLAVSLRKPVAHRLASKGLILFGELVCWGLFLGAIVVCIFLNKLYPFYLLFEMKRPLHVQEFGAQHVQMLLWSVYGLIGLSGVVFLLLARSLSRIRKKNDVLQIAGTQIKLLVGQHLQRKAAIDAIEQRHFNELPATRTADVNEVPNPAYEADEGVHKRP